MWYESARKSFGSISFKTSRPIFIKVSEYLVNLRIAYFIPLGYKDDPTSKKKFFAFFLINAKFSVISRLHLLLLS